MGFDQAAALYNHYTVHTCRLTATFVGDDLQHGQTIGVYYSSIAGTTATLTTAMERPGARVKTLTAGVASSSVSTVSISVQPHQTVGKKFLELDTLTSLVSDSPVEGVYFVLFSAPNRTFSDNNIHVRIKMEFIAEFAEPKPLTGS